MFVLIILPLAFSLPPFTQSHDDGSPFLLSPSSSCSSSPLVFSLSFYSLCFSSLFLFPFAAHGVSFTWLLWLYPGSAHQNYHTYRFSFSDMACVTPFSLSSSTFSCELKVTTLTLPRLTLLLIALHSPAPMLTQASIYHCLGIFINEQLSYKTSCGWSQAQTQVLLSVAV